MQTTARTTLDTAAVGTCDASLSLLYTPRRDPECCAGGHAGAGGGGGLLPSASGRQGITLPRSPDPRGLVIM